MTWVRHFCAVVIIFTALPLWCQSNGNSGEAVAAGGNQNTQPQDDDRMQTPAPVSGEAYATAPGSEERSNYLRYGVAFTSAYSDNVLGSIQGHPVSDISYSVAPFLTLDTTTSQFHWLATYAPGFTFYQHTNSLDQTDQHASIDFQYRLSPHLTLTGRDGFQKVSSVFNRPDLGAGTEVSGNIQNPNVSVIAPLADVLSNAANVGLNYQFAMNGMIGGSGSFFNLHYLNPSQVPGLSDTSSRGGSAYYTQRLSRMHYVGMTYQYQKFLAYPSAGVNQTETHAVLLFYTLYPNSKISVSFFGGPQYSNTVQSNFPTFREWTPAAGASMGWQARLTGFAVSYSHALASGGGLMGAVNMSSLSGSLRQQITKTLSGSLAGGYTQNDVLASSPQVANSGHSILGTASLERRIGEHFNVQLGYTRLHQTYKAVPLISLIPNTNREFISLSYQFARPLGK